ANVQIHESQERVMSRSHARPFIPIADACEFHADVAGRGPPDPNATRRRHRSPTMRGVDPHIIFLVQRKK
ncbi:hypothetical protein ACLOJK_015139, partial [Asimina triloba]